MLAIIVLQAQISNFFESNYQLLVIYWKVDHLGQRIRLYPKDKISDKVSSYCKVIEVKVALSPNYISITACTTTCWHAYSSTSSGSSWDPSLTFKAR